MKNDAAIGVCVGLGMTPRMSQTNLMMLIGLLPATFDPGGRFLPTSKRLINMGLVTSAKKEKGKMAED